MSAANPNPMEKSMVSVLVVANALSPVDATASIMWLDVLIPLGFSTFYSSN
jgi:hypothetical protein